MLKNKLIHESWTSTTIPFSLTRTVSTPRGGGGLFKKFNTERLRPKVHPLTLLYAIFAEKVPLLHTFYWEKVPAPFTHLLVFIFMWRFVN